MMEKEALEKELLKNLSDGVVEYDEDMVREAAQKVVSEGLNAYNAVMNGLAAGMQIVGELYDKQEYFVPEMLMCADALYVGMDIINLHIVPADLGDRAKGQVVIGNVQGDVHDIGKNIIKLMFEVAGFEVHDLGKDVPLEKFVEEQLRTDSEIVALSVENFWPLPLVLTILLAVDLVMVVSGSQGIVGILSYSEKGKWSRMFKRTK